MVWVGLDEVVVAGVGVGRGERAGGDHGEVQDGGWGVGLRIRGQNKVSRNAFDENLKVFSFEKYGNFFIFPNKKQKFLYDVEKA